MNSSLINKKIVIAGAGGLLGASLVKSVLNQGACVIALDIDETNMMSRLQSVGVNESINSGTLTYCSVDVCSQSSMEDFFKNNIDFDGFVNATYPRNKDYGKHLFDVTLDSFNDNVSLHLGSAFLISQMCAASFKQNRRELSLVNIASVYGVVAPSFDIYDNTPMTMPVEYAAIKSGILHLNKYICEYISDSYFRINSVSPGGILDGQPESFLKKYKEKTHGKGMLEVSDVLGAIMFLLSEQSKYITGQNLIVDDGFTL